MRNTKQNDSPALVTLKLRYRLRASCMLFNHDNSVALCASALRDFNRRARDASRVHVHISTTKRPRFKEVEAAVGRPFKDALGRDARFVYVRYSDRLGSASHKLLRYTSEELHRRIPGGINDGQRYWVKVEVVS